MHHYPHHIGDYRKDTAHLSLLEHGVYRQLLDTYYTTEKPLTLDDAFLMRTHCARSADEMQAVRNVLNDFFVRTDDGWVHKRCDIEIESYQAKSSKAGESAKARWDRVRAEKDANALPTHCQPNANREPITKNQEPKDKIIMSSSPSANIDDTRLEKQKTNKQTITEARDVLAYLNKNAGKNFRDVDSTLGPIVARLKEGYTPERLREIAFYKIEQWGADEKMAEYLRPATLYNATKCAQYDGELGS